MPAQTFRAEPQYWQTLDPTMGTGAPQLGQLAFLTPVTVSVDQAARYLSTSRRCRVVPALSRKAAAAWKVSTRSWEASS